MSDLLNEDPLKHAGTIEGIIKCNDTIMEYFRQDIVKRKNSYKPKLKDTQEHRNAIHEIFKEILKKELDKLNLEEAA